MVLLSIFISCLIILSVFIPLMEQKRANDYRVFTNGTSIDLSTNALIPTQLFINKYHYGFANTPNNSINGQMNFGLGILLLVLPIFFLFVKEDKDNNKRFILQTLILGIICLIATTKVFPWKYFEFAFFIQIAWRLNSIITICLALVSAYSVFYAFSEKKEVMYALAVIIAIVTSGYLDNVYYCDYTYEEEQYVDIGQGEYLPSNGIKYESKSVYDINNKDNIFEYNYDKGVITFELTKDNNAELISVPFCYYKGYQAFIETENGNKKLDTSMDISNGLTEVYNSNKLEGKVTVKYVKTPLQIISYLISYGTLICIFIYMIIRTRKGKKWIK